MSVEVHKDMVEILTTYPLDFFRETGYNRDSKRIKAMVALVAH